MSGLFVGLDIGGTKTEALVVDTTAVIRGQIRQETITTSPADLFSGVVRTIQLALQQAGAASHDVAAIGLGIPGQVNVHTGDVQMAVNLGVSSSYPLGSLLSLEFHGVPVVLENDVRLAAIGVYHHLQQQHALESLAYLAIGTGISAGVILNGELYRGTHGMAGEIGHIIVEEDGAACICGQRGCLETVVAGPAIIRQAAEQGLDSNLNATTLFELARTGDSRARIVVQRVSRSLARAIQMVVMTYDVEKIVLGGGVTSAGASLLHAIFEELAALRAQSELARAMLPDSKISLLPDGFSAGTHGAILLARKAAQPFQL